MKKEEINLFIMIVGTLIVLGIFINAKKEHDEAKWQNSHPTVRSMTQHAKPNVDVAVQSFETSHPVRRLLLRKFSNAILD